MSSSSLPSTTNITTTTVAVGIDLGSFNARVATYDENLQHPVVCHNNDGHRETRVVLPDIQKVSAVKQEDEKESSLQTFYQDRVLQLARESAHSKDLHLVTSVPNHFNSEGEEEEWLRVLQGFGSVITEAAAICLAYNVQAASDDDNKAKIKRVLVIDGGASGVKATVLSSASSAGSNVWVQQHHSKLESVNGTTLIEPLAKAVATQFEQKNRFPRGEVWENSKKARAKLQHACEAGMTTLHINQSSVTIHVDGLYEGVDCQVVMSKPKWEHLSSALTRQTKTFLSGLQASAAEDVDAVLLSGNLATWLQPLVKQVFGDKLVTNSSVDPSEAVAMGCTQHAFLNVQQQRNSKTNTPTTTTNEEVDSSTPTLQVPVAPVSIGIQKADSTKTTLIAKGTPLPCLVTHDCAIGTSMLELWQLEPTAKALAKLEELDDSSTLRLQLSTKGQLRIWVNGESLVIG